MSRTAVNPPWIPGLDGQQTVGGCGRYRALAGDDVVAQRTCVWRGHEITTISATPHALCVPELGDAYQVSIRDRDWTGKSIEYRWRGGGLRIDLRSTLPGPLFTSRGKHLRLRWPSGAEPGTAEDLVGGDVVTFRGTPTAKGRRIWLLKAKTGLVLLVASAPITAIHIISHMHWDIAFARAGARCFVVPLLDAKDAPRDPLRQKLWLSLAEHPPTRCRERFRDHGDAITIESRYPGAALAPLPAFMALLGTRGGLCSVPEATTLLAGWDGPYAVVRGNSWQARIAMAWAATGMQPTRTIQGRLSEIPEELAYAGDASWEPGTCIDQCLALRTWAPLVGVAPTAMRQRLIKLLKPPTIMQLRRGVEVIREPSTALAWGRLRQMWDHNGDACYDVDWYNGFVLSGLERATQCADPAIANPARATVAAGRAERDALAGYFAVFHDWSLCSAWSDPRGWMWNADCCHNGLEGILAEARLRREEGRQAEASLMRYLAARTAVSLLGSCELPAWHTALAQHDACHGIHTLSMRTWSDRNDAGGTAIATQALVSWRDRIWCTTQTRNPYLGAGNFPQWNALLRMHFGDERLALVEAAWNADRDRHHDWIRYYLGDDWQERRRKGDQEARIQAAVFYHLAPEVAFRRFALGEDADTIESRFATPLHLAEQLLLRAGFALTGAEPQLAAASAVR